MQRTLFGERLRELRKERSLQQSELGEIFGISPSAIGSYERGLREPVYTILVDFCKFFGVSVDYMLGVTDERMSLEYFLQGNEIDFKMLISRERVIFEGAVMTDAEKQRLIDMARAMLWDKI